MSIHRSVVVAFLVCLAVSVQAQTPITSTWDGNTATWSSSHWDVLGGSDSYPDNNGSYVYDVFLPSAGGAYTVTVTSSSVQLDSLFMHSDATLVLTSTDFYPGSFDNEGVIRIENDQLYLTETIVNDGIITWDIDTGTEYVEVTQDLTFSGGGAIDFPDNGQNTTSYARINVQSSKVLINGPSHTISGGPGYLYAGSVQTVNQGTIRADNNGRTLYLTGGSTSELLSLGVLSATNGGRLEFATPVTSTGTLSCDASSEIGLVSSYPTADFSGTVAIDGLLERLDSDTLTFNGATGTGTGTFRNTVTGAITFTGNANVGFGRWEGGPNYLHVHDGSTLEVRDLFTHSSTAESQFNFNLTGILRITGGTAAGPTDYDDFAAIEIAGSDDGPGVAEYTDNFDLPHLKIGPGAKVNLFDVIDNGNRNGSVGSAEALYVETLEFEDGSGVLNLNGHNLYYQTLVGSAGQIADSGGGSGKSVFSTWICGTGSWTGPCWDVLGPGDTYPDNGLSLLYDVSLPANAGTPYDVTVATDDVVVSSTAIDADASLLVEGDGFRPGDVHNDGTIELGGGDLVVAGSTLVNDALITFDPNQSTGAFITEGPCTLSGTGTLLFPDTGAGGTTHYITMSDSATNSTLVHAAGHTIEGANGGFNGTQSSFRNEGTIRSNVAGRTISISVGSCNQPGSFVNEGLITAESGGLLSFSGNAQIYGDVDVDASSAITAFTYSASGCHTGVNFYGTFDMDGLMTIVGGGTNGGNVGFHAVTGAGAGAVSVESKGGFNLYDASVLSVGPIELDQGTLYLSGGSQLTTPSVVFHTDGTEGQTFLGVIQDSRLTVQDAFVHSFVDEADHDLDDGEFRFTGGTAAGPTDYAQFAYLEVGGNDMGVAGAGFIDNFSVGKLIIGPGAKVNLFDTANNGNRGGVGGFSEALYVDVLEFEDGAGVLNLNGLNLYYNGLIGGAGQIVDSGAGSVTGKAANWICTDGSWSNSACWTGLAGGDFYPDDDSPLIYTATLPSNGGTPYTVSVAVPDVTITSLAVDADATLDLTSDDFDPGQLVNSGTVRVLNDELLVKQPITNDGMITFPTDSVDRTITASNGATIGGTGQIVFPIGPSSYSYNEMKNAVNGATHTIRGGPGYFNAGTNDGSVIGDVPGEELRFYNSTNNGLLQADGGYVYYYNSVSNDGTVSAVNGGHVDLYDSSYDGSGTWSCDASSSIANTYPSTCHLYGVLDIDGLFERNASGTFYFNAMTGASAGEFRQTASSSTVVYNAADIAFGAVSVQSGNLEVSTNSARLSADQFAFTSTGYLYVRDGCELEVTSSFSHTITTESNYNFYTTGILRMNGGTTGAGCSPGTFAQVEVAGSDNGAGPASNNFEISHLKIAPGAQVLLVDAIDNGNRNGPSGVAEALYVDTLEFEDGAGRIDPNGLNIYYTTLIGNASQVGTGTDCNNNGVNDACDISGGTSLDCNGNGIPDECEVDCNGNGIPDSCDIGTGTSLDCNGNGIPDECEPDCNNNGIADSCEDDCNANGVPDECDITFGTSLDCNSNGIPDECETDCNGNGIPDDCEPDCNSNGLPDDCDIDFLISPDCNQNGVPDECDISSGTSLDTNFNGIPDECELDCNLNFVPDIVDIANGTSIDCDGNLIPDECQGGYTTYTWVGPNGGAFTADGNWDLGSMPGGTALLSNAGATDNTAVLAAGGVTTVCNLDLQASGAGVQAVSIAGGSELAVTTNVTTSGLGGVVLAGGTLDGASMSHTGGDLGGFGTLRGPLTSSGTVHGAINSTLVIEGASLANQAGGTLRAPFGSFVDVQSTAVTQQGDVEVHSSASMYFEADLVNESGGSISVLGGALATDSLTNDAGGMVSGFGLIQADVTNDGDVVVLADAQIVGDVANEGAITVQNGLLTIIGTLSGAGTLVGDSGGGQGFATTSEGLSVLGDLDLPGDATLDLADQTLKVSGDVIIGVKDPSRFDLWTSRLQLVGLPGGQQRLEALAQDLGPKQSLTDASLFPIGELRFGPAATQVKLVDHHDNAGADRRSQSGSALKGGAAPTPGAPGAGQGSGGVAPGDPGTLGGTFPPEALYVGDLVMDPGVVLDLAGHTIYYLTVSPADPFSGGSGVTVVDSVGGGGLVPLDCNDNGVGDGLDVSGGTSLDCNANGLPDECEPDCDGNGVPDSCDISAGTALDCNANGSPDSCDISSGSSVDANTNGIPDECEMLSVTVPGGSAERGRAHVFRLEAGAEFAGRTYLLLGTSAGRSPGTPLGGALVPLNLSAYFEQTLDGAGQPPLAETLGVLDGNGSAVVTIPLGGTDPGLAGLVLDHAFVVLADDETAQVVLVSNAVTIALGR
jgi:hypothetical protein